MPQFELDEANGGQAKIKVIGAGGGGGNAINTMITAGLDGVEFVAANTDSQVLIANLAGTKIQLGENLTRGLGAGGNPEVGRNAALEQRDRIAEVLAGADMVFVTAGMGGGTGTGAAPIMAQISREMGILTVAVVTRPFQYEGKRRARQADEGIAALSTSIDCLLVVPNQKLLALAGPNMPVMDAFKMADEVLLNAVRGICDIITVPGLINVDFADVRSVMTNKGRAIMGMGRATGGRRAAEAMQMALASPLLEDTSIQGATGVLVNISGPSDMTLHEVAEASSSVEAAADESAQCIIGSVVNANLKDEVRITVIATGFDQAAEKLATPQGPPTRRTQIPLQLDGDGGFSPQTDPVTTTARFRATGSLPRVPTPPPFEPDRLRVDLDEPTFRRRAAQKAGE